MTSGVTRKLTAAALFLTFALGGGVQAAAPGETINAAPAFTGKDMAALPTSGWLTNGGNLWNQRYSPLKEINKDTIKGLKAEWRTSLNGSGMTPRSGNQAQPIVYDGIIYIQTGENDAFAVSVETGKLLWEYKANVDAKVARPCLSLIHI